LKLELKRTVQRKRTRSLLTDARRDAARDDGPEVGEEPLGGVETEDVDRVVLLESQREEGFGKRVDLTPVLFPGPRRPLRFGRRPALQKVN